ncbi:MFS transporter [Streptomyces olivaceus]|uniref:MFS transporter n=1 Tax=Streptomyces olivaceus TaxID=47716 RepID=UPI0036262316
MTYRGRATSVITSVSYLGFLLGPVYVGLWADATGLRGAMIAVAALAAALSLLALPLLALSRSADRRTRQPSEKGGRSCRPR